MEFLFFWCRIFRSSSAPLVQGDVLVRISLRKELPVSVTMRMLEEQTTPTSQRLKQQVFMSLFSWLIHLGGGVSSSYVALLHGIPTRGPRSIEPALSDIPGPEVRGEGPGGWPTGFEVLSGSDTCRFCSHFIVQSKANHQATCDLRGKCSFIFPEEEEYRGRLSALMTVTRILSVRAPEGTGGTQIG